jgi:hypothetical protein
MHKWHWFQIISNGILALFLGIILYVVIIAYTRESGSIGLNMATIQKMRYDTRNFTSSTPSHAP